MTAEEQKQLFDRLLELEGQLCRTLAAKDKRIAELEARLRSMPDTTLDAKVNKVLADRTVEVIKRADAEQRRLSEFSDANADMVVRIAELEAANASLTDALTKYEDGELRDKRIGELTAALDRTIGWLEIATAIHSRPSLYATEKELIESGRTLLKGGA